MNHFFNTNETNEAGHRMGLYCSALRQATLPNLQRQNVNAPEAPVAASSIAGVRNGPPALRAYTVSLYRPEKVTRPQRLFEEGFALGLKVRKLQNMLEAIDADEAVPRNKIARTHRRPPEHLPDLKLEPDKLVVAEEPVPDVPAEDPDDILEIHGQCVPLAVAHNTLDTILQENYKPWCHISNG